MGELKEWTVYFRFVKNPNNPNLEGKENSASFWAESAEEAENKTLSALEQNEVDIEILSTKQRG